MLSSKTSGQSMVRSSIRQRHVAFRAPGLKTRAQSGRAGPFNENAAQVKRLISRDRKEFLGNDDDILDKYETEFGTTAPVQTSTPATPTPAASTPAASTPASNPFGSPSTSTSNPFGSTSTTSSNPFGSSSSVSSSGSNPFGAAPPAQPFKPKSSIEPAGLRPDMGPDPMTQEKGFNLFQSITLTQVVLFFSFSLIIALMISTFYFVFSVGAVRLNGI